MVEFWRSSSKDILRNDWGNATNEATTDTPRTYRKSTFQKKIQVFLQENFSSYTVDMMLKWLKILENLWENPARNGWKRQNSKQT